MRRSVWLCEQLRDRCPLDRESAAFGAKRIDTFLPVYKSPERQPRSPPVVLCQTAKRMRAALRPALISVPDGRPLAWKTAQTRFASDLAGDPVPGPTFVTVTSSPCRRKLTVRTGDEMRVSAMYFTSSQTINGDATCALEEDAARQIQ